MYPKDFTYFILFSIVILLSPLIPTNALLLLDTLVVRIAVVFVLLFLISLSPFVGIFGFIAVGILYIERNRRKVATAMKKLDQMDVNVPKQATVMEASTPQSTVPVQEFDEPDEEVFSFLPKEEGFNDIHFDSASINEKAPLSSVYPLQEKPEELYEQMGVGHVPGVETLGNSS
jgi:hypothetical protein